MEVYVNMQGRDGVGGKDITMLIGFFQGARGGGLWYCEDVCCALLAWGFVF